MINNIHILAQAAQEQGANSFSSIMMIVLIIVMFYFVAIRPAQKQRKAEKQLQDGLKAGDKIITKGGIFGIIREVQDIAVKIEVAPNVVIKLHKSMVGQTVGKDGSPEN